MKRSTFLITGATGNTGSPLIRQLLNRGKVQHRILAGVRHPMEAREILPAPDVEIVRFDFAEPASFAILEEADRLFLLRPPALADVSRYFAPLIDAAAHSGIEQVVFLSVQGADRQSWIPHHKIEELILKSGLPYTFLRPSYFMQNFTTTLRKDIREQDRIFLPAGKAPFNLVDTRDIARLAAEALLHPADYRNIAIDVTGPENLTFAEMAEILSEELERPIRYESPNPLYFMWRTWKERAALPRAFIMTLLHYLPRWEEAPHKNNKIWRKMNLSPTSFRQFVREHRERWLP